MNDRFEIQTFISDRQPVVYGKREDRNRVCASLVGELLQPEQEIVNVGSGGERFLQTFLPEYRVTDIDIAGDVDHRINLETELPLPFGDRQFQASVCLDVLEHLDNLHDVFEELCRITSDYIIISLPNPASEFFKRLLLRRAYKSNDVPDEEIGKYSKYYGLPKRKPIDRHKWFFCFEEAVQFFVYNSDKMKYSVKEVFCYDRPSAIRRLSRRLLPFYYYNLFAGAIWIVLEKDRHVDQ